MGSEEIKKYCILDTDCDLLLRQAVDRLKLSARSYFRILKLSRTIADLEEQDNIQKKHLLEALSYRKSEE